MVTVTITLQLLSYCYCVANYLSGNNKAAFYN
jgi:hypothetical protein